MASKKEEIHYQLTVGLRFSPRDAPALRLLAQGDSTHDPDELSAFERVANCAEAHEPLVVQCMTKAELEQIVAHFFRFGIRPTIEDLRLSIPRDGLGSQFRNRPDVKKLRVR